MLCFAPYASEYHYEAWIFPRRHVDNITLLTKAEFSSLTHCLKIILNKMQELNLSFNLFLHNVISDKDQHFYIKIQPRDSVWAGVELGSGLVINSVPPEEAAKFYRE
jgi:UDPglucose--hexose-1-phosphate uridylyltransferase